ncbi:MAG: chorismate-binding protein [Bacteroidota bacterium]
MPYPEPSPQSIFFEKLQASLKKGFPFCAYRKPGDNLVRAVFQSNKVIYPTQGFQDNGFVFAPYDWKENAVFIPEDEVMVCHFESAFPKSAMQTKLLNQDQESYVDLVKKAISTIKTSALEKVVVSRKVSTKLDKSPLTLFNEILKSYPNAFCYLWHHSKIGTWCGATPESFLKLDKNNVQTMALAGTLWADEDDTPNWTQKEIHEQQLVTDFISDSLGPFLKGIVTGQVTTVKAGGVFHLKTPVSGTLRVPDQLKGLIEVLHPTPAVCGTPTELANAFITQNETHNRRFYCGFLGELNPGGQPKADLFVNLRCMELEKKAAHIYVGGGITRDSKPEQEWEETQFKSKTMLALLQ